MKHSKFPLGWDEERIQKVLAFYGQPTEGEAVAEDEGGVGTGETLMSVPGELVPLVRELIAKRQG